MNWTELLKAEIQSAYTTTDKLLALVDDDALEWKPSTGRNWMTTGQLLRHITEGCGVAFRAFITGDWGLPEGTDISEMAQLPPAEKLPTLESVAEARRLLEQDKQLAFEMLALPRRRRTRSRQGACPLGPHRDGARPSPSPDGRSPQATQGTTLLLPEAPREASQYGRPLGDVAIPFSGIRIFVSQPVTIQPLVSGRSRIRTAAVPSWKPAGSPAAMSSCALSSRRIGAWS